MTAATVSRWARRYVLAGAVWLTAWQAGVLVGVPRRTEVVLGLFGFVLHVLFGKAYSLVPTYFDRSVAFPGAPAAQFPFAVGGTAGLAAASLGLGPAWVGSAGAALWSVGVALFVGTLAWSVRGNPTGRETATGETNEARRPVDRLANAFVPVALLYLLLGTYATLAAHAGLPPLLDGYPPRATHLLAAGTAGVMLFALGFRLLPRFTVAHPPRSLVRVALPAGAVGPALLAVGVGGGDAGLFRTGAVVESLAVTAFAAAVWTLVRRSDRRRVGFYGVLAGASFGVVGVALGLSFAFGRPTPSLVVAHLRTNLLGFLGLSVVGVTYQFYPPAVGVFPGASDRTARLSIAGLVGGLLAQLVGVVVAVVGGVGGVGSGVRGVAGAGATASLGALLSSLGRLLSLGGALLFLYLVVAAFEAGRRRRASKGQTQNMNG